MVMQLFTMAAALLAGALLPAAQQLQDPDPVVVGQSLEGLDHLMLAHSGTSHRCLSI